MDYSCISYKVLAPDPGKFLAFFLNNKDSSHKRHFGASDIKEMLVAAVSDMTFIKGGAVAGLLLTVPETRFRT